MVEDLPTEEIELVQRLHRHIQFSRTYTVEKLRRVFGMPRTLYKRLKRYKLNHRQEYWETIMIAIRRLVKQTEVEILNCLNISSSDN